MSDDPLKPWLEHSGRLPITRRPPGAYYPLPSPNLRERQPEFEKLREAIIREFSRRKFPPIVTDWDKLRLDVMLYRFLYSPEWPRKRSPEGEGDGDA